MPHAIRRTLARTQILAQLQRETQLKKAALVQQRIIYVVAPLMHSNLWMISAAIDVQGRVTAETVIARALT